MFDWIKAHPAIVRTALVAAAATAAVLAVTILTGGIGAPFLVPLLGTVGAPVVAAVLSGAAGGAVGYLTNWALLGAKAAEFSLKNFLITTAVSGALSLVGGLAIGAAGRLFSSVASRVASDATATAEGVAVATAPRAAATGIGPAVARSALKGAVNTSLGAGFSVATNGLANELQNAFEGTHKKFLDGAGYAAESGAVAGLTATAGGAVADAVAPRARPVTPHVGGEALAGESTPTNEETSEASAGIVQALESRMANGTSGTTDAPASPVSADTSGSASSPSASSTTSPNTSSPVATPKSASPKADTGGNGPSGEDDSEKKKKQQPKRGTPATPAARATDQPLGKE